MKLNSVEIHPKIPFKNVLILKFTVGYPVKYADSRLNEQHRAVESYIIMVAKADDGWHTYNNAIYSFGEKITSEFARGIQNAYDKLDLNAKVVLRDNIIETKLPTLIENYLDNLAKQRGVVIEGTIVREMDSAYMLFYFADNNYEFIGSITMQLLTELNGIGEIIYMGSLDYEEDIPYFYYFAQTKGINASNFRLMHTKWEFDGNELNEENEGIFTNSGLFYPKYFSKYNVNLVLVQDRNNEMKRRICEEVEASDENTIYECAIKSSWFTDFHDKIISRKVGAVTTWWSSDGNTHLDSYYIIYDRMSMSFLSALNELYTMDSRKNHRNIIVGSRILRE